MSKRAKIGYIAIPDWAIGEPGVCSFAAAIALAGMEGKWFRLSAATQRKLLGYSVFGKVSILCDGMSVTTRRSACFGMDSSTVEHSWSDIAEHAHAKRKVST